MAAMTETRWALLFPLAKKHFTTAATPAAGFVKATKVIGVHYDTFGWIKIDHNAATKAFADKGIELLLPSVGETIGFQKKISTITFVIYKNKGTGHE